MDLPAGSGSINAVVSEKSLRGQLVDGKKIPFERILELFCLVENVSLEVKLVEDLNDGPGSVCAVLSERQVLVFHGWVQDRFDRLVVLGSVFSDVEKAMKSCRLSRDVIRVESLGVLESVVLCKLGTDAVGLIPKLGRFLKSAVLVPFSPKNILKEVGNEPFDE